MNIIYAREESISIAEFIAVLDASGLGARRPVGDPDRIGRMIAHANLIVTARHEGKLIGVARSLTDFSFCCYMSDLAVDRAYQKCGIGRELIRRTQEEITPQSTLLLLHAPEAAEYYAKVGFEKVENGWIIKRKA